MAGEIYSKERFLGQGDQPWSITARSMTFREKEQICDAEGDVVILRGELSLYAQKVIYNMKTGIAELSGDVRLEAGEDIITGDEVTIDLNSRTGRIINGSLFLKENHFYIKGGLIEKLDEDTYLVKDCHITTCDGVKPAWSITGSEVRVTVEGYGTVKQAALRIRDVPVAYVPYMIFPAKTKRQTGLLPPRLGHSSRNGTDVELPFFWAISNQTDATLYQHYMSKRGYMQGLEFRYIADEESKGSFLLDILSDREDKDMNDPDDVELSPFPRTNETRYWFRSRADQNLPFGLVARLDADYVSDQDYLNEFERGGSNFESRPDLTKESGRPVEDKRSPLRTSRLRLSRDEEGYSLQALASYYQLSGNPIRDVTAEPLGGLDFGMLPFGVGKAPFFFKLDSDYDYVWREEGQKGHRAAFSPELSFPLWLGRYLEFEPWVRYTFNPQSFGYSHGDFDSQNLNAFEVGSRVSTNLARVYDHGFWGAKRLKHKIRPTLGYSYRDLHDGDDESPWFEPVKEEGDANLITFSFENFLDARLEDQNGHVFYRQWAKLMLSQSYDIDEERNSDERGRDDEPFEPLYAEMILRPWPNLYFFGAAEWDHYDEEIIFADFSLNLSVARSGGRRDRLALNYQYDEEEDRRESINFWFDVNLAYGLSAGSSLERDLDIGENISNRYWLQYQRQCWGIRFAAEKADEETSVMLEFQLLGLGDIGVH